MPTTTYSLNLPIVGGSANAWGGLLNENWTLLDKWLSNTFVTPDLNATTGHLGALRTTRLSGSYTGITGVGALNAGSITSGFGNINVGVESTITCGSFSCTTINASGVITGNGSGVTNLNANNLTAGIVSSDRINGNYVNIRAVGALEAGSIVSTFGNINIGTSTFTGNGSGLTALNATNITSGTLAAARLPVIFGNFQVGGNAGNSRIDFVAPDNSARGPRFLNNSSTAEEGWLYVDGTQADSQMVLRRRVGNVTQQQMVFDANGITFAGQLNGNGAGLTINASNVTSGTLAVARLPVGVAARDWVGERNAEQSVNAIGTYAFLRVTNGVSYTQGQNVAGANLTYASASGNADGGTPSGTWKCMGRADGSSNNEDTRTTLFLRIL